MKGLIFEIRGKYASFKKYYSNSSIMTYYYPPRTVLIGIIAGIIGYEKDSYYEEFSKSNLKIGIGCDTKLKKKFHTINYLKINSKNEINGSCGKHTQIPFELISSSENNIEISYNIYVAIENEIGERIINKLFEKLKNKEQVYPVYLGKAGFSATCILKTEKIIEFERKTTNELIYFSSVIAKDSVLEIDFTEDYFTLSEDKIPIDFEKNGDRTVKEIKNFIFSNGKEIKAKVNKEFYCIKLDNKIKNIMFLE